jgi:antitoxin ParD1/3/4
MNTLMQIKLPSALKEWVEDQVATGDCSSPSEYVKRLLQAEQRRTLREQIDKNLLEALDSGESTPWTKDDMEDIRREARKRLAQKGLARNRKKA